MIDIDSVPATGGTVSTLGTIDGALTDLAGLTFAPDGTTMAWSVADDGSWSHTVVHVRAVGGGSDHALSAKPVAADQALLSFSADGRYLLVDSRMYYGQYACCAQSHAVVYPADGGDGQPIAGATVALFPAWAPSGHALVFSTPLPHAAVCLVAEPGGTPHSIESGASYNAANSTRLSWTAAGVLVSVDGKPTLYKLTS